MLRFLILFVFIALSSAVNAYSQNDTIIYLEWAPNSDPLRSITINWITDIRGGTPSVEYRLGSSGNWMEEAGTSNVIPDTTKQRNSVSVTGLSPGRSYQFRISDGSLTNKTHRFRTPPSSVSSPLEFIVGGDLFVGDGGQLDANFASTATEAASRDPWFAVLGGDLANADANPDRLYQWFGLLSGWYEHMITDDGFMIPLIAGIGNHEVPGDYDATPAQAKYFHAFLSFPRFPEAYDALDFGTYLSIILLNTNHTQDVDGVQADWLENTLDERREQTHVFPVYHTPAWPGRDFPDQRHFDVRDHWVPLFEDHALRFVFEHDNHLYKRTYPLVGDKKDDRGIIYMGDGGWGVIIRPTREGLTKPDYPWWYIQETVSTPHFLLVEITDTYRKVTSIDNSGDEFDEVIDYLQLPPVDLLPPDNITETDFRINWEKLEGAKRYRLDVSTNSNFNSFISGYENRNVQDRTNFTIQDLSTNTTYYYRLRAEIPKLAPVVSENSDVQSVKLVKVDPDKSEMAVSQTEVLGDGIAYSTVTVTIRNEFGEELDDVNVSLGQGGKNSQINHIQDVTGSDGIAIFQVSNTSAESVTYSASAAGTTLSQTVKVNYSPVPPEVLSATNHRATGFRANWEPTGGALTYFLDVAEDEEFTSFLPGLENRNVGNQTHYVVDGLTPGTQYYYRVRVEASTGTSDYSSVLGTSTLQADPDMTTLTVTPSEVLADGLQKSTVTVHVQDQSGINLDGVPVILNQKAGNSEITTVEGTSDVNGEASFTVTNTTAESVDYFATAGIIEIHNSATVDFTPLPPVALNANEIGAILFTAEWEEVPGANEYRLDVSETPDFSSYVTGFDDREIEDNTEFGVTGLSPGTIYYYRVRAVAPTGMSTSSNTVNLRTLIINEEISTVAGSAGKVLANGVQESILTIQVFDENEEPLEGVPVSLEADNDHSVVREIEGATDETGKALLAVSSESSGKVTYRVFAGGIELDQTMEVDFIEAGDEAVTGNNYPNPFRERTTIPLTVPEAMHIQLYVINTTGAQVLSLKDEEMTAGYYEIPVDTRGLASGTYFYVLITNNGSMIKNMLLIR